MLEGVHILYIFVPILVIGVIFLIYKKRNANQSGDFNSKLDYFKFMFILFGIALLGLWFYLPSTPSLASFGHPNNIEDIDSKEELLKLFQDYNQAIVKTTQVVHWLLFLMIFWFLSSFIQLINFLKK
ncbi:hypothetical protein ACFQ3R_07310 [Mesonia ostreae]|uniref:Uncharacterized protein n=1 Tax=Mesonia ostreae TaxID=861110 RepID=A0ABU2KHK2_9FLAO|nr:hypothetical protein [Mesonia ostreae]MDT0294143.1 hypothetical protein [Mesonia ostreae]